MRRNARLRAPQRAFIVYSTLTGTLSGKYGDCLLYTHRDTLRKKPDHLRYTHRDTLRKIQRLSPIHSQGHYQDNTDHLQDTHRDTQENIETVSNTLTGTSSGKYRDSLQYTHRDTLRKIQRFVYNTLTGTLCNAWREVCFHLGIHHIIIHNKCTIEANIC